MFRINKILKEYILITNRKELVESEKKLSTLQKLNKKLFFVRQIQWRTHKYTYVQVWFKHHENF